MNVKYLVFVVIRAIIVTVSLLIIRRARRSFYTVRFMKFRTPRWADLPPDCCYVLIRKDLRTTDVNSWVFLLNYLRLWVDPGPRETWVMTSERRELWPQEHIYFGIRVRENYWWPQDHTFFLPNNFLSQDIYFKINCFKPVNTNIGTPPPFQIIDFPAPLTQLCMHI